MSREESYYPQDWFRIAKKDLERVQRLILLNDPEDAGFHLQQAVEKYRKAIYSLRGGGSDGSMTWRL